jgi:hypothetical protein
VWGTSSEAHDYSIKEYNRCKQHSKCKCDYFDLSKTCELCNSSCIRRKARVDGPPEIVGPFEFGEFRNIDKAYTSDEICKELEEYQQQNVLAIMKIHQEQLTYEHVIKNPELIPPCWYNTPHGHEKITRDIERFKSVKEYKGRSVSEFDNVPQELQEWKCMNIDETPERPMSLLLIGDTRTGKTEWARSLGVHVYWNMTHDLAKWNEDAKYIILDDWRWVNNGNGHTSVDYWKGIIGCQKEFVLTDKYTRKQTCHGVKPCIILSNKDSDPRNGMDYDLRQWFFKNVVIVELNDRKLYKNENIIYENNTSDNSINDNIVCENNSINNVNNRKRKNNSNNSSKKIKRYK